MKKLILKTATIVAAFFLGIFAMSYYQSAGNNDLTDSMADATLPLVCLEQNGELLNLMHGYTQPMEGSYMRDAVLPLPEDRTLHLTVQSFNAHVRGMSYEVRSLDTTRLVEDTEIGYSLADGYLKADVQLKDLLDPGQEYQLVFKVQLKDEREIYYYTRITTLADTHLQESLDFVKQFHEATFDKENTVSIAQYLEPDTTADNSTLEHVTIHSRYRQIIWGDMPVEKAGPVRTYVTEIDGSVASIRLEYNVSYKNENQEAEMYEIQESFRVRYTNQRMYLLDYDRTADRIFDPSLQLFTEKAIQLGILNTPVEYKKNEEENIVGFVQNGELWCYDAAQNKLSYVFGFRKGEDPRCSFGEHDIRIMKIDETGSMYFLVCGYMNRGIHEGRTGVAVYYYDAMTNSEEEKAFLESTRPYSVLKTEIGKLSYVNQQEQLYFYFQGAICSIDLNTRELTKIVDGVAEECCLISNGGQTVAWHEENSLHASETIELLDLETGARRSISAREGAYIRALGFMGTDFIYGEAKKEDLSKDLAGNQIFPMGRVTIQDQYGKVVREFPYEEQGKYVVDIAIESNRISLSCVAQTSDGGYQETDPEPITYKTKETVEKIALDTRASDIKKREYLFTLADSRQKEKLKILMPKQVLFEGSRNLKPENGQEERFYVYAFNGRLTGAYREVNEAVLAAYDRMGVVVDGQQNYLWKRGGRKIRVEITGLTNPQQKPDESSLQASLEILLGTQRVYADTAAYLNEGVTPYEILQEHLEGQVLDLSGCSVQMVLYYVSQGYPVLALEGDNRAELIIGYDQQNVILLDPLTGEAYKKGMNDSTEYFGGLGNLFIACLPDKTT